jgi:hypothetical protein
LLHVAGLCPPSGQGHFTPRASAASKEIVHSHNFPTGP